MRPTGPVTTRAIGPEDEPFLRRVYASTREEELSLVPWDDVQKGTFLRMQFDAQHRSYRDGFPRASFDVILQEGRPVGRLYVDRCEGEIHIIDIALLPEARGIGIGGAILAGLIDEGRIDGKPIRIHVERGNRALRLYRRLGFREIGGNEIYYWMERPPDASGV